jgi:hypothetical protein
MKYKLKHDKKAHYWTIIRYGGKMSIEDKFWLYALFV